MAQTPDPLPEEGPMSPEPRDITDPSEYQTFIVYDSTICDLRICPLDSDISLFFVDNSFLTPNKPDLTLHAGADKQGLVLGVGHFPLYGAETIVWGIRKQISTPWCGKNYGALVN